MASTVSARLDRLPLSRVHHRLLIIGGLGYTFDTPEVFLTFISSTGTGLASAFGRIGSIIAPLIIGITATSWGFAGVFGMTTAILAVGVLVTLFFAVSTKGMALEDINQRQASAAGS